MGRAKLSKADRRAILDARNLIAEIERMDANEAETRRRVERVFEQVMGYDALKHLSRERAVHGAGDTEHVDFAVQLEPGPEAQALILVELKRVGLDLSQKHLKQASRYAVDAGTDWVLLTNGRQWQLHHVEFGKPPRTKLVEQWNLLHDDVDVLARKFGLISLKSLKRGLLDGLWETTKVLAPHSLLKAILSARSINALRRVLRQETGVTVTADHIVSALRKVLNENAAAILDDVEVSLPTPPVRRVAKPRRKRGARAKLADAVNAGVIPAGALVFAEYKGLRYEATVQPDGALLLEGTTYNKVTEATAAVTAKHGRPRPYYGARFWKIRGADGAVRTLASVLKEHAGRAEVAPEDADAP